MKHWAALKHDLAATVRSLAAQKAAPWKAIVVANEGADLPDMPDNVDIVRVDFPVKTLPAEDRRSEAFFDAVRADKGGRVLHGLVRGRAEGHVMVVDHDDLVSNRLAALVAAAPDANGWFFDSGYIYSGGAEMYHYEHAFHKLCGTSHIVRADLLKIPARVEDAGETHVRRWFGSHISIAEDMAKAGTPLSALAFPGAIYRMGHPETTSGSPTLDQIISERSRQPGAREVLLSRMVPLSPLIEEEFFAGKAG